MASALPLLPWDEVRSPLVFVSVPMALATTSTETVQLLPAESVFGRLPQGFAPPCMSRT